MDDKKAKSMQTIKTLKALLPFVSEFGEQEIFILS